MNDFQRDDNPAVMRQLSKHWLLHQPECYPVQLPRKRFASLFRLIVLLFAQWVVLSPAPVVAQNFNIDIAQFDQWIFSNMQSPENARRLLADRVEMEIHRIGLATELHESQKEKIRLAAKGDIKRFFDKVEEAHRKFEAMQAEGRIGQNDINEIYQLAMPLQQQLNSGLFGGDSFMQKVSRAGVNEQQAEELRRREQERQERQTESLIAYVIANLNRQIPMLSEQRQQLSDLLNENVKVKAPSAQYATHVVMIRFSELPREKISAILDAPQLKAIEKHFDQAVAMKQHLKTMGLLDE